MHNLFAKSNHLNNSKIILGINTGGGNRWQLKKWVLQYYIELIELITTAYPDVKIILFGGPEEVGFNKKIIEEVDKKVVNAGCDNSLMQFTSLINLVDLFFTPDSLGMHIAIALNKPTLVNVGPTSPWELDVYNNGTIIYNDSMDCIGCYNATCDKNNNCMNTLKPKLIFKKITEYL